MLRKTAPGWHFATDTWMALTRPRIYMTCLFVFRKTFCFLEFPSLRRSFDHSIPRVVKRELSRRMDTTLNPVRRTIRLGNSLYVYVLFPILLVVYGIFAVLTSEKPLLTSFDTSRFTAARKAYESMSNSENISLG